MKLLDVEKLFKIMLPVLKEYDFLQNAAVCLNFVEGNKEKDLEFKLSSIDL